MTAPTAGAAATLVALDNAYRAASAEVAVAVARAIALFWRSVDIANLRGTSPAFIDNSAQAVVAGQRRAVIIANAYTDRVRRIAAPGAPLFTPPPPAPPNLEQIRTSIEFLAVKQTARQYSQAYAVRVGARPEVDEETGEIIRDDDPELTFQGTVRRLNEEALRRTAGAATRYVTESGRDQVQQNVRNDQVAIGWVRTTRPGCCYFCAMLASRGAVYKKDSFAISDPQFDQGKVPSDQKVHDHCGCGLRPVYSEFDPMPERVEEFSNLWVKMLEETGGGADSLVNFRRLYEGRPMSQPERVAA